jgi:hypothetical protein
MHIRGVSDTAEIVSAVSMTQLSSVEWCNLHRFSNKVVEFLCKFQAIFEKSLTRAVAQGKLFEEKTRGRKYRVRVPLIFGIFFGLIMALTILLLRSE